jgi:hypothetical protein
LQLADLLAHPARRWAFKNLMEMDEGTNTFSDKILSIMEQEKFFRYQGRITGYGVKKLP